MPDLTRPDRPGMLSLLRGNSAFRRLWTARLLSFIGDSVGLIALLLYTAQHFGSGLAVALLMIAGDFVPSLVSPFAGAISDRWDRRTVMVCCEIAQGVIVAAIAFRLPALPLLLALVALQSCVAAVFQPASRSVIPSLVADADLERANAAIGSGTYGIDAFAPLAAATLLVWLSIRSLLFVDVASFAISAVLLLRLPRLGRTENESDPTRLRVQARAGVAYMWQDRVIRIITLTFCVVVLFNAVDDVALVFLTKHTMHASNAAASVVYAGVGIGMLAGFALLARKGLSLPVLILAGYAISSLGNLLTGFSFAVVAALGFQVVRGLGIAGIDVGHDTLIQRRVPAAMLGRVFGNFYGAVGAAAGLSYILGGLLLDETNARVTLVIAGLGGLAAAGVAAIALPRALRADALPGSKGSLTSPQK